MAGSLGITRCYVAAPAFSAWGRRQRHAQQQTTTTKADRHKPQIHDFTAFSDSNYVRVKRASRQNQGQGFAGFVSDRYVEGASPFELSPPAPSISMMA